MPAKIIPFPGAHPRRNSPPPSRKSLALGDVIALCLGWSYLAAVTLLTARAVLVMVASW